VLLVVIAINVVFAALVLFGIVGLHLWAIWSSGREQDRLRIGALERVGSLRPRARGEVRGLTGAAASVDV
jgi:uncharacterized membrane protein YqjE